MSRQHAAPIVVPTAGAAVALASSRPDWDEAFIQELVHSHPACLPIQEIDPLFVEPVPLCRELNTPAGPIDNVLVTPTGLPVLVECKLWSNPQARREVVGQILDYAKELSRWTASDFQREVTRRPGRTGNAVLDLVREAGHQVDEVALADALTLNLRRGRLLLLIVGDGIRESVKAIAEYLQAHAGLHFTLGLVEFAVFDMPGGGRLVAPRVLARTATITREVVLAPEGMTVSSAPEADAEAELPLSAEETSRRDFMLDVQQGLRLSDPDQLVPKVTPKGWLYFYMPVPSNSAWIGVLDKRTAHQIGVRLTSNTNTVGEQTLARVAEDWPTIRAELGGNAVCEEMSPARFRFQEFRTIDRDAGPSERAEAIRWLRERLDAFVTVFRPRIRAALTDLTP